MPATDIFRRLKTSRKKNKVPESDKHTEEPAEELFSTAGAYGLRTVAEGATDTVDIVFVHGLTGNRETTWTYKKAIFWPKDLLAKDLDHVRIFTFGYDADVVKLLTIAGGNTVRDHGKSLAQDLSLRRAETNTVRESQV
ncbi:hypothetical protein J4E93_010099 [Alternaria ventricosa]|uniref:uncharacterized protein n=1 Tax=Alternaria ventricosa TaxID=1187951 RepID=UPI0020C1BE66|nr:uncharacterized protein J4E93_010099 [Alternaria ventricosa]KAI4638544.1 hypothetical protein J4E93_010099 [Alternaria ventricosa]